MTRRQSLHEQWLILEAGLDDTVTAVIRRLPRGSGVLVLGSLRGKEQRRLRVIARQRHLTVVSEGRGIAARVHNQRKVTRALLGRAPLVLLSPMHPTGSHPDWKPMSKMRAATLAALARRQAIALGGMDARRYAKLAQLGFSGWAGISAFRT